MDCVERIKELCKERGIALSRLERDCGFSNSYISGLKKGVMPPDRLEKVATYLGVSTAYLVAGDNSGYYYSQEASEIAQELSNNRDLRVFFSSVRKTTPEQFKVLQDLVSTWLEAEKHDGEDPA